MATFRNIFKNNKLYMELELQTFRNVCEKPFLKFLSFNKSDLSQFLIIQVFRTVCPFPNRIF